MKIILSRKGFDSGYGGYPSPILPDGKLVSFPIPDINSAIKYNDLHINDDMKYSNLIYDLIGSRLSLEGYGKINVDDVGCHLDPDICNLVYPRKKNWKGLFGQAGAAQGHLRNKQVSAGDIFLFFGWFRHTIIKDGRYIYDTKDKTGKHVIYGYMEVGEKYQINRLEANDWMRYHPHVSRGKTASDNDYIYVAKERLSINPKIKGYGTFRYNDVVRLTKEGYSRSKWQLPDIFKDTAISYHSEESWKDGYFQSAAKGQEFVIESTYEINKWVKKLIERSIGPELNIV